MKWARHVHCILGPTGSKLLLPGEAPTTLVIGYRGTTWGADVLGRVPLLPWEVTREEEEQGQRLQARVSSSPLWTTGEGDIVGDNFSALDAFPVAVSRTALDSKLVVSCDRQICKVQPPSRSSLARRTRI